MRNILVVIAATIVGLGVWSVLIVWATLDGWWRQPLAPFGNTEAFAQAVIDKIDASYQGNVAFTLIENGDVVSEHFASIGESIDNDSLFQVASMGKWITAFGVMTLVERGKLNLDKPISTYLTRWQLPPGEFNNNDVTVRRLLSHTAGLTDGLGYLGFKPGEKIQTIEQALSAPNATRGPGVKIEVGIQPGTGFKYSGGGYLILQLLVEEVSGQRFETFMQQAVFQPLEMTRSTYSRPADDVANVALSYNNDGTPGITYSFTAVSASGLYTTTADMTRFIQAHLAGARGAALSQEFLSAMREPHGFNSGMEIWGLGTILYAADGEGSFAFGHDGKNDPAINTTARVNPATGDGFILLETGNDLLATNLGSEWTFWQTGKIDILTIGSSINGVIKIIIPGWIAIVLLGLFAGWRMRTKPGKPA